MDTPFGDLSLKTAGSFNYFNFFDENESEYLSLFHHQIQPFYPDFASALSKQSPRERELGRCVVVDLSYKAHEKRTLFQSSDELRHYLSISPEADSTDRPRRRLFILEDLSSNWISILGSRLRIPPSFFASHYADPASAGFNQRNAFGRHSPSQFRLRYADSHRAEVDVPPHEASNVYAYNTNVFRYVHAYDPNGPLYDEMRSNHDLSFWSSPIETDGAWDAVLLVDPPLGDQVKLLTTGQLVPIRRELRDESSMPKHYLFPELNTPWQLSDDSSAWAYGYQMPQFRSMFDDVLNDFASSRDRPEQNPNDPRSFVELPRKIAISNMLNFYRRRYMNLLRLQNKHAKQGCSPLRINCLSNFSAGALARWHDHYFDFIVGSRAALKEMIREMEENMVSVGITVKHGISQGSEGAPGAATPPQWEIDGWLSVMDLGLSVDDLLTSLATGYMQYITIQEARVSGANAQSLSKITVATMLFIPLSTIAGIFSMSDDYLPGKSRAWVFWVVSFPFLLSLAYLYWRQQLLEVLVKKKLNLSHFLGRAKKPKDVSYV